LTETAPPPADSGDTRSRAASPVALVAAVAVLVGFGVFVCFLAAHADSDEIVWTRLAWLFSAVQAVVFAAAGLLFGANLQRRRAEHAEDQARGNADAAAKGRALAEAIKADADAAAQEGFEVLGPAATDIAVRHAALARALFP
jgi:hypothetical protein